MEALSEAMRAPLFRGIAPEEFAAMLNCIGPRTAQFRRGEMIALEDARMRQIGIVLSGAVDMVKEDFWGNRALLARMGASELFGETFACGEDDCPTAAFVAAEDARVLFLPFHKVMRTCARTCAFHQRLIENMVHAIAYRNRELMHKVEVVSKRTLREKILADLSYRAQAAGGRAFEMPLGRVAWAEYLCADRSALTRELVRMRSEGLIDYHRNRFALRWSPDLPPDAPRQGG